MAAVDDVDALVLLDFHESRAGVRGLVESGGAAAVPGALGRPNRRPLPPALFQVTNHGVPAGTVESAGALRCQGLQRAATGVALRVLRTPSRPPGLPYLHHPGAERGAACHGATTRDRSPLGPRRILPRPPPCGVP